MGCVSFFQMTGGPSRCPERATRSHLNRQTTNVSSEHLMARRKLAQWWAYCICLCFYVSSVYISGHSLLMLNSHFVLFQVSTKEVIKFQMVGRATFMFQFQCHLLFPWVTVCRFSWLGLLDVNKRSVEHYLLLYNSVSLMNEPLELNHLFTGVLQPP